METAVTFDNKAGQTLFGIVHTPDRSLSSGRRIAVNLLNPGIKYRVAPNRLNVSLARELCAMGLPVLRFDPGGVGDSQGELPERVLVADIWESIQKGAFVSDTISANDFLVRRYGIDELILVGNCGGAITALLASAQDSRIAGLCLIDVPVNLRTSTMSFADKVAEGGEKAEWFFREYLKKAFRLSPWVRFFTFKTDYRSLLRIMGMKLLHVFSRMSGKRLLPADIERLCRDGKLNRLFFESFEVFARKRTPTLFVLAANDPGTEVFQRYFEEGYLGQRSQEPGEGASIAIAVIANANHVYAMPESRSALMGKIKDFVSSLKGSSGPE